MSEIRANTVSDAAGTGPVTLTGQYAAKAWVNFNGTGTVAIRESANVSSITDNGGGLYALNFSSAMSNATYNFLGHAIADVAFPSVVGSYHYARTASSSPCNVSPGGVWADAASVDAAIHGDLA